MAGILYGKEVNALLNERVRKSTEALLEQGIQPKLSILRVGENPGDLSYERNAVKRCESLGVACERIALPEDVSQEELIQTIEGLNSDRTVHGVLLFRPLPRHLDQSAVQNALNPEKDVDCMTDLSLAGVFTGKKLGFPPCTARACLEILDYYGFDVSGKRAAVIGRSLVIGKPAAMLLMQRNATVTVCHTKTVNMPEITRGADIIIAACGKAGAVGPECLREGQIVIDVGINVDENGKLCGDVDFEAAESIVSAITPVPGGVGAVTTSVLACHVVEAAMRSIA